MSIDRKTLVSRHNPENHVLADAPLLQIGNGEFAFACDATGLQTFGGNTMAQWSWHSSPLPSGLSLNDFRMKYYRDAHGNRVGYPTSADGQEALYKWRRENPHRFSLGRLRFALNGKEIRPEEVSGISQRLCLWTGNATSRFKLAGEAVVVEACCHPERDGVVFRIESALGERLAVVLEFPYGDPGVSGACWSNEEAHCSIFSRTGMNSAEIARAMDDDRYFVSLAWRNAELQASGKHQFRLQLQGAQMEFACEFSQKNHFGVPLDFAVVSTAAAAHWEKFWITGGAVDLSGSEDPRWMELERRIVLSQYLLAVNCSGTLPPQESGLYNNSGWYGKFHLEMHFWHGAHWALWGRWPMFARSHSWYEKILPIAGRTAREQGYRGARWPKMTSPDGLESPSVIGPLLIWQQAHPIFYAELDFRLHPGRETLDRWREIVFASAEFMASFAAWDEKRRCYILGPPLKTVPENNPEEETFNPFYELQCWRWGLQTAMQWQVRSGLPVNPEWKKVFEGMAPPPCADSVYLLQEKQFDCYEKWNWEHPSQLGAFGLFPALGVDAEIMRQTVRKTYESWDWNNCWGWDFPMAAMAAARSGEPSLAIELLLHPSERNSFDSAGLSRGGPYPYFPSNGGLLYAVALMAAGWDGAPGSHAPGFPENWHVVYEELTVAP